MNTFSFTTTFLQFLIIVLKVWSDHSFQKSIQLMENTKLQWHRCVYGYGQNFDIVDDHASSWKNREVGKLNGHLEIIV